MTEIIMHFIGYVLEIFIGVFIYVAVELKNLEQDIRVFRNAASLCGVYKDKPEKVRELYTVCRDIWFSKINAFPQASKFWIILKPLYFLVHYLYKDQIKIHQLIMDALNEFDMVILRTPREYFEKYHGYSLLDYVVQRDELQNHPMYKKAVALLEPIYQEDWVSHNDHEKLRNTSLQIRALDEKISKLLWQI